MGGGGRAGQAVCDLEDGRERENGDGATEGKAFAGWSEDGQEPDPVADDLRAQAGLTRGDSGWKMTPGESRETPSRCPVCETSPFRLPPPPSCLPSTVHVPQETTRFCPPRHAGFFFQVTNGMRGKHNAGPKNESWSFFRLLC